MSELDKRKLEFQQRDKHNKIESILRTMRSKGITLEDLQGYTTITSEMKLKERREIQAAKAKATASLIKARAAKQAKHSEGK
jgi:hypothetical protein